MRKNLVTMHVTEYLSYKRTVQEVNSNCQRLTELSQGTATLVIDLKQLIEIRLPKMLEFICIVVLSFGKLTDCNFNANT